MDLIRSDQETPAAAERIFSLDVFRGLTILLMIFANELDMAMIRGVPWWMKHAVFSVRKPDFITFVDVIAPAFLFIVGTAIPSAIRRRIERGKSNLRIWAHILIRSIGLMIIGVFMGNMRASDVLRNSDIYPIGMSHAAWSVLLLASFILVWNDYPKTAGGGRVLFVLLRLAGIAVLVYLAVVYRQGKGPEPRGMQLRWYVIGTIGWSYLTACGVYFVFRRQPAGMVGCLALLIALNIGDRAGALDRFGLLAGLRHYLPLGHMIGGAGSMAVAGLIVGVLFTADSPAATHRNRLAWMLVFAAGLFAGGYLLRPLYGLSSPGRTPTLSLYTSGISCLVLAALYLVTDVWRVRRWAAFALPAGRNPLVPYFLAFMLHPLTIVCGLAWVNGYLNTGVPGILRTACVAIVLGVFVPAALSRLHVRVRL